jgi:hypothetical protein
MCRRNIRERNPIHFKVRQVTLLFVQVRRLDLCPILKGAHTSSEGRNASGVILRATSPHPSKGWGPLDAQHFELYAGEVGGPHIPPTTDGTPSQHKASYWVLGLPESVGKLVSKPTPSLGTCRLMSGARPINREDEWTSLVFGLTHGPTAPLRGRWFVGVPR